MDIEVLYSDLLDLVDPCDNFDTLCGNGWYYPQCSHPDWGDMVRAGCPLLCDLCGKHNQANLTNSRLTVHGGNRSDLRQANAYSALSS